MRKLLLMIIIFLLVSSNFLFSIGCNEDENHEEETQDHNRISIVFGGIQLLITVGGLILTYYGIRKRLRSTEKLIFQKQELEELNELNKLFADLFYLLTNTGYTKVYEHKYISEKHLEVISGIKAILSDKKTNEKKLKMCIEKFRFEKIKSIHDWVEEIDNLFEKVKNEKKAQYE